jgi:hypothetical protein
MWSSDVCVLCRSKSRVEGNFRIPGNFPIVKALELMNGEGRNPTQYDSLQRKATIIINVNPSILLAFGRATSDTSSLLFDQ